MTASGGIAIGMLGSAFAFAAVGVWGAAFICGIVGGVAAVVYFSGPAR